MRNVKVGIIDCGIGNIRSVYNALKYLGVDPQVVKTSNISNLTHIILPGVGSFVRGMTLLNELGLDDSIKTIFKTGNIKILGICLGMQLLGESSTEGGLHDGLKLINNKTTRLIEDDKPSIKIPHVGFSSILTDSKSGIFFDLSNNPDFYFTHSYKMMPSGMEDHVAISDYGNPFLAAFRSGNVFGAQFHPEKSQTNGLIFLRNFIRT